MDFLSKANSALSGMQNSMNQANSLYNTIRQPQMMVPGQPQMMVPGQPQMMAPGQPQMMAPGQQPKAYIYDPYSPDYMRSQQPLRLFTSEHYGTAGSLNQWWIIILLLILFFAMVYMKDIKLQKQFNALFYSS